DDELDLCAEFAQVAMLAGEEAAAAVSAQRTAETDPDTGLLRTEPLRAHLQKRIDATRQRQKPLSVLAVLLDQADSLRAAGGADARPRARRPPAPPPPPGPAPPHRPARARRRRGAARRPARGAPPGRCPRVPGPRPPPGGRPAAAPRRPPARPAGLFALAR